MLNVRSLNSRLTSHDSPLSTQVNFYVPSPSATIKLLSLQLRGSLVRFVRYSALALHTSFAPDGARQTTFGKLFSVVIWFDLIAALTHNSQLTFHVSRLTPL